MKITAEFTHTYADEAIERNERSCSKEEKELLRASITASRFYPHLLLGGESIRSTFWFKPNGPLNIRLNLDGTGHLEAEGRFTDGNGNTQDITSVKTRMNQAVLYLEGTDNPFDMNAESGTVSLENEAGETAQLSLAC